LKRGNEIFVPDCISPNEKESMQKLIPSFVQVNKKIIINQQNKTKQTTKTKT